MAALVNFPKRSRHFFISETIAAFTIFLAAGSLSGSGRFSELRNPLEFGIVTKSCTAASACSAATLG